MIHSKSLPINQGETLQKVPITDRKARKKQKRNEREREQSGTNNIGGDLALIYQLLLNSYQSFNKLYFIDIEKMTQKFKWKGLQWQKQFLKRKVK